MDKTHSSARLSARRRMMTSSTKVLSCMRTLPQCSNSALTKPLQMSNDRTRRWESGVKMLRANPCGTWYAQLGLSDERSTWGRRHWGWHSWSEGSGWVYHVTLQETTRGQRGDSGYHLRREWPVCQKVPQYWYRWLPENLVQGPHSTRCWEVA